MERSRISSWLVPSGEAESLSKSLLALGKRRDFNKSYEMDRQEKLLAIGDELDGLEKELTKLRRSGWRPGAVESLSQGRVDELQTARESARKAEKSCWMAIELIETPR